MLTRAKERRPKGLITVAILAGVVSVTLGFVAWAKVSIPNFSDRERLELRVGHQCQRLVEQQPIMSPPESNRFVADCLERGMGDAVEEESWSVARYAGIAGVVAIASAVLAWKR